MTIAARCLIQVAAAGVELQVEALTQLFSGEFCEIFTTPCFTEHH